MYIYCLTLGIIVILQVIFRKYHYNNFYISILCAIILIGISAFRSVNVGNDLHVYLRRFACIAETEWQDLWNLRDIVDFEFGYILFCKILSLFSDNPRWFIFITSVIIIGSWEVFFYKNSPSVWFSNWIFITLNIFFGSMNLLRQFLAMAILYHSLQFLNKKRYKEYVCAVLLASTMHSAAIIWLALIVCQRIKIKATHLLAYMVFIFLVIGISPVLLQAILSNTKYSPYLKFLGTGSGYIKLLEITIIFLMFALYYYRNKRQSDSIYIHTFIIALGLNLLSLRISIAGRLVEFFFPISTVLLPSILQKVNKKRNYYMLLVIIFLLSYMRFVRYCQVDLGDVVPYQVCFH